TARCSWSPPGSSCGGPEGPLTGAVLTTPPSEHPSWTVRRAGPDDAAMLAALGARLFGEAFARDNTPEDMARYLATHFTPEVMSGQLARPGCTLLVLEREGAPEGWAQLLDAPGGALEIRRFYVDGRSQGSGAAVTLMSAALSEARAHGAGRIWLAVWEHNRR